MNKEPTDFESVEEIKKLKAKYCRFADTKQWQMFHALFTDDAVLDLRAGLSLDPADQDDMFAETGYLDGKESIETWTVQTADAISTLVHQCHTPEIEFETETKARGIWAMEDRLQFKDGGPIKELHGFGHYHETYERTEQGWRIASVKLTRTRVDITS